MEWTFERIARGFGALKTSDDFPIREAGVRLPPSVTVQQSRLRHDRSVEIRETALRWDYKWSHDIAEDRSVDLDPRRIFSGDQIYRGTPTYMKMPISNQETNTGLQDPLEVWADRGTFIGAKKASSNAQRKYTLHIRSPCI